MPDIVGIYLNEKRFDILGTMAARENISRARLAKQILEEIIDEFVGIDIGTKRGLFVKKI